MMTEGRERKRNSVCVCVCVCVSVCMQLLYSGMGVVFFPALRFYPRRGFPHYRFFQEGV